MKGKKRLILRLPLKEHGRGMYRLNYALASKMLEDDKNGNFKANQAQGALKGRKPHTRIQATENGMKAMKSVLSEIESRGGFNTLYTDPMLRDRFVQQLLVSLGNPSVEFLGTAGAPGEYSGTYPAFEVKFKTGDRSTGSIIDTIEVLVVTFPGARVAKGKLYQDSTVNAFSQAISAMGGVIQQAKTAKPGSQLPDIEIEAITADGDSMAFNAEVKGPGGKFFDKTLKRGMTKTSPEIELINKIAVEIAKSNGYNAVDLESYIDELRMSGIESVGYIGDPGVSQKSGSLPAKYFRARVTPQIVNAIKNHWAENGDTYFVVSDGNNSYTWYTGHPAVGATPNPLNAPEFSTKSIGGNIDLTTYGTAKSTRLRVAPKVNFNLQSAKNLQGATLQESLLRKYIRESLLRNK